MTTDLHILKVRARARFGALRGVLGFGVGDAAIRIYVEDESACEHLPDTFEGVRIEPVVVGAISVRDDDVPLEE